jgi:hypothetical protein
MVSIGEFSSVLSSLAKTAYELAKAYKALKPCLTSVAECALNPAMCLNLHERLVMLSMSPGVGAFC